MYIHSKACGLMVINYHMIVLEVKKSIELEMSSEKHLHVNVSGFHYGVHCSLINIYLYSISYS